MKTSSPHLIALAVLTAVSMAAPASAHQVGLSRSMWTATPHGATADLVFARAELESVAPGLARGPLDVLAIDGLRVTSAGQPCRGELRDIALESSAVAVGDGVRLATTWTCDTPGESLAIHADFIDTLPRGHRHLASSGGAAPAVLTARQAGTTLRAGVAATSDAPSVAAFVPIGVEHILFGPDHLVFLFALLLVGGRLRDLLAIVTAFTVGHSVTLALATLDLVAAGPALIEPAIALSVAWVGLENFVLKDARGRWKLAALFGLIHGFGFAGALAEVGLPAGQVVPALFAFNVGVELGQLAVVAAVVPLLAVARRREWYRPALVPALSSLIVVAGAAWFVERVVG